MAKSADPANSNDHVGGVDEVTPLLGVPDTAGGKATEANGQPKGQPNGHLNGNIDKKTGQVDEPPPDKDEDTPLPVGQILALCYASLVEPVAYFSIFPYIQEMVEKTGGQQPQNVGFFTGLIEALFSLVQMLLMIFYGRLSDRLGRKPVLIFSLTGVAGASALFGLSRNLWQMVLFRCVAGLFAGSSVTIRAMLSENCTKYTQARAFSWYMFARNLGIFIGPLIGGGLSNASQQYPIFERVQFFIDYPYALPSFVTGVFCLSTAVVGFFVLNETLKGKVAGSGPAEPPMTIRELLRAPGVGYVLLIYGHCQFLALCYTAVNPVFLYTPIELGGTGFSPQRISIWIILAGGSQALWMLLAFPTLQRRTSTGTVLRTCAIGWAVFMALYPLLNEMLRAHLEALFWPTALISIVGGSGVAMSFACVQLNINDISPSPTSLGTLNAVALTINSAIRAVAPVAATSLYATGVRYHILHGHLAWVFIVAFAVLFNFSVRLLPEKAEGRLVKKSDARSEEES
nr:hypothetical protein B0A51_00399 [Rachicladosporium sp. CCFEE 5018]